MQNLLYPNSECNTALVTGASGNLGVALCARLRVEGWRVIGISSRQPTEGSWHRYVAVDLSDDASSGKISEALADERPKVVWHLAGKAHALGEMGQNSDEYRRINVRGTKNALVLAQRLGARRFILASSVKAMGEGSGELLDEDAACRPLTPYGRSKLEAESLALGLPAEFEPVVLRFCMIYGGTDRGNMGRMMQAVKAGKFPPFPETNNRRSFVYIEDAVTACILAGTLPTAVRNVFLVTDTHVYSTRQLYLIMRRALGLPATNMQIPVWVMRFAAHIGDTVGRCLGHRMPLDSDTLAKLIDSSAYSSAKITRMLGFKSEWPLEQGLLAMAQDFKKRKMRT